MENIPSLSLSSLRHRCAEESARFFRRQDHDPRYCYELFRRAAAERDEHAWELIYEQYLALVSSWVERHPMFPAAEEDTQFFVNRAFEKMWAVLTPEKFDRFPDFRGLMRYFQMCVHSALVQNLRGRAKTALLDEYVDPVTDREALSASAVPPIPVPAGSGIEDRAYIFAQAETLWNMLQERLQDEKERRLVQDRYVLALQPHQILIRYPELFTGREELNLVQDRFLQRLNQDLEIRDFFALDDVDMDLDEQLIGMVYRVFCPESQELGEYFLGFLPEGRRAVLETHCADCPHCTRELDQLQADLEALQTTG